MPSKKPTRPKLICKTPWLERIYIGGPFWGLQRRDVEGMICRTHLDRLFHIPHNTTCLRALLWDSRAGRNSLQVWLRHSANSDAPVYWTAAAKQRPAKRVAYTACKLLLAFLFRGSEPYTIKTAWLEIEIKE